VSKTEVILSWSDPQALYLGSHGETREMLSCSELWDLITRGRRDTDGSVVTSLVIWTQVAEHA